MTPEPVILGPDATVADALAHVRNAELTPARWPPWSTSAGRRWRRRPAGSSASRTSSGCCASRPRRWSRRRSTPSIDPLRPEATHRRGRGPPGDLQPGRRARRRRRRPAARRGHRRRPARPHAARRTGATSAIRHRPTPQPEVTPWLSAARRGPPRHRRKEHAPPAACAARRTTRDAFGVFAEQFARFMGTARFLIYMTVFVVVWVGWNAAGARTTCASTTTRSSS